MQLLYLCFGFITIVGIQQRKDHSIHSKEKDGYCTFANLARECSQRNPYILFREIRPCTNKVVHARFTAFGTFLCVSMSVLGVFVR